MQILAVEFDAAHFCDIKNCHAWLKNSDYDYLLDTNSFRLRQRKKCIYLSGESRKVLAFYNNLWKYPHHSIERPMPHVAIVKKTGTEAFTPVDLPEQLPETVERNEQKAEKLAARQEKERERREKRKAERKEKALLEKKEGKQKPDIKEEGSRKRKTVEPKSTKTVQPKRQGVKKQKTETLELVEARSLSLLSSTYSYGKTRKWVV